MSRCKSHDWYVCRALYQVQRDKGAPVVSVIDLGAEYFAETADGKIRSEHELGCCAWAVKYQVAARWIEKHGAK